MKTDWFPNWSGQTVVIVASGPSASTIDLRPAKEVAKVVGLNSSIRLCPWADLVYGCDAKWWLQVQGLPDFTGLKVAGEIRASETFQDVRHVKVLPHDDRLMMDERGVIGSGGNSGFQAINLAVQFGARRFILVGYDMRIDAGLHWHGRHPDGLNNPNPNIIKRWRRALDGIGPALTKLGAEVWNCSPVSALEAYEKVSFPEALDRCLNTSSSKQ